MQVMLFAIWLGASGFTHTTVTPVPDMKTCEILQKELNIRHSMIIGRTDKPIVSYCKEIK